MNQSTGTACMTQWFLLSRHLDIGSEKAAASVDDSSC